MVDSSTTVATVVEIIILPADEYFSTE